MQTFLPYRDFFHSAQCLDPKRLGKQRVEAYQIVRTLLGETSGWANHPAVRMWRGHEQALITYGMIMSQEWRSRGYVDNMWPEFQALSKRAPANWLKPRWVGKRKFHSAHRAALLYKAPEWYSKFGWDEEPIVDYWWPV
jgi:hypothetical protein